MRKRDPHTIEMFSAAASKREAMDRVYDHAGNWKARAFAQGMLIISRYAGAKMTGEQLRFLIAPHAGEPHHHNAWGPLIEKFIVYGLLTKTPHWVPMSGPRSNARSTRLYLLTPHA